MYNNDLTITLAIIAAFNINNTNNNHSGIIIIIKCVIIIITNRMILVINLYDNNVADINDTLKLKL